MIRNKYPEGFKEPQIIHLPLEKQKQSAERMGFGDDLEAWRDDTIKKALEAFEFKKNRKVVTVREYLDRYPIEEQYAAAAWVGRVFRGDAGPTEVLKEAGYDEMHINQARLYEKNYYTRHRKT